jgi:multimeric flavodoxin WrbA
MKVIGINASPRKKANTQTLIEAALAGAAAQVYELLIADEDLGDER